MQYASQAWNYADVWEAVARTRPDAPALYHGNRTVSWRDFDARADGVASALLDADLPRQAKVSQYLRNRPEFLESLFAAFKIGFVPVNTNFRYTPEELLQLWDDSETSAVVFDAEFTDSVDRLRTSLPRVRLWLRVGLEDSCPDWAVPYEEAAEKTSQPGQHWSRSGDDIYLLYTGGTTGQPKGVMWRQDDLFRMLETSNGVSLPETPDPDQFVLRFKRSNITCLPAAPLVHGTACWYVLPMLSGGGSVVTLTQRSLDPIELLDAVVARQVKGLCIVGEAFARPVLRQLETSPDRWDLSSVRVIFSAGAILSRQSKERLLHFAPQAKVVDGLGSSEAGSLARSISTVHVGTSTATFRLSENARVIDENGKDVVPGSGQAGRLAVTGYIPLGYYRDPAKTATTFVQIDGRRYVVPGDWAEVTEDGSVRLLGRGSSCINTGGEKVFPEEVEEVLKTASGVLDAGVVGIPDERFGEVITALVQPEPGAILGRGAIITHVRRRLAGYKLPKHLIFVDALPREENGKINHSKLRSQALEALGLHESR